MIDFTTIQANPIPPSIIELQSSNTLLKEENKMMKGLLIIGGILTVLYLGSKVLTYLKEDDERKNKV